jgi:peptidoglycan/xylan/chitin deacetylase (PgdA/CDA1 family)
VADRGAVSPTVFEAQMGRLHDLGFQPITLDAYVRFMRGKRVELPRRPILLTFDDGYTSALTIADAVLARYGWSAAVYIPTGSVGRSGRLDWDQLRQLHTSGRWQVEEHAGDGHVYVDVDASGTRMPFYAAERWVGGRQETFAEYKSRVSDDIALGAETLRRHLPGWRPHGTFAVPYGDYGQRRSNDARIEPWFTNFLKARFAVTLVQARDTFATPGLGFAHRMPVPSGWDAGMLETHLLRGVARVRSSSP